MALETINACFVLISRCGEGGILPFSIGFPYGGFGRTVTELSFLTIVKLNMNVRTSDDITRIVEIAYKTWRALRSR